MVGYRNGAYHIDDQEFASYLEAKDYIDQTYEVPDEELTNVH